MFSKKDDEEPMTPRERLESAVDEINEAWAAYRFSEGRSIAPWIDWANSRVILRKRVIHREEYEVYPNVDQES